MGVLQSAGTAAFSGVARCGQFLTWPARAFGADFSRQDAILNALRDSTLGQNDWVGRGGMDVGAGMVTIGFYGAVNVNAPAATISRGGGPR